MFLELQRSGLAPDHFTLSVLIGAAGDQHCELSLGTQFHAFSVKFGYEQEEFVANSLIHMYASSGRIKDSVRVFEGILDSDNAVAWNSMIAQFTENELHSDGLKLYGDMQKVGVSPTPPTLSSVLKACSAVEAISEGKQVHAQSIVRGFLPNVILETVLVDFYSKCGELENGRVAFEQMENRNAFTWNCVIRGYSRSGCSGEALQLFRSMRREGIAPDKFTYTALLAGVATEEDYQRVPREEFRSIHACVIKEGLTTDIFIGTSLITMYSRNQSFDEASLAFEETSSEDNGVWSAMVSAAVNNKEGEEALKLFARMLQLGIKPNPSTFSCLFTAIADLSALEAGKQIHGNCLKDISFLDTAAKNSLINMYSNCGLLAETRRVFSSFSHPNVVSFNSMISALAQHGLPTEAVEVFENMEILGLRPDHVTLLNLLSAFNHAGAVHEGLELLKSMKKKWGIEPRYQHYACAVDMLARAGDIEQATGLINQMPFEPDTSLWRVVLGACGKHWNIRIAREVAERMIELEPYEATNYVLIANVYARLGRWTEAERIRNLMEERGVQKEEGVSWVEINRRIYKFGVNDNSHPRHEEIFDKLRELMKEISLVGYKPDVSFTVHDMEEERREESLWYHAERLAFAFGVISTSKEVKLRIMKNLRVCGDCHSAFKHFSLITEREIILKDKYRFHHFSDGVCSCGDYW